MTDSIPAPFVTYTGAVPVEWMDYNGHMMDGYYLVAFTDATESFLEYVGFGPKYREQTGSTIYTVEGHINFLREVKAGTKLKYATQLLDYDAKRFHLFHHMIDEADDGLAATNELMFLHFNQRTLKVEPMPPDNLRRVAAVRQAHSTLPRPSQAGRRIGISHKPAS
jgi:acyl-CoA thioesterase FadM